MLASTHLDPVVGIDIHWEMIPAPPAPPIPTPLPNPFVGIVEDPMGLVVGVMINQVIGALTGSPPTGAVTVNMMPATNTGTEVVGFGHMLIPPGVSWAPMPSVMPVIIPKEPPAEPDNPACPDDNAIVITGSKTVHVMGANFSRLGDIAMSCSEPVRLPSSLILAIPKGLPVLVGGPPTLDAMAAAGAFIRTQWVSHQLNNLLSHLSSSRLRNLLSRVVCFLTGHPVDVATGRVFTSAVDFDLPGPLPLRFERVYNSGFANRAGPLGYGWSHSLDQRVWEERGKVVYLTEDGREVVFDAFDLPGHRMQTGDELYYAVDRLRLKCLGEGRWEIWTADEIGHEFGPVPGGDPAVARLLAKKTRSGHRIELSYDERARLSWVCDSAGRRLRFVHDDLDRLTEIKLPVSRNEGLYRKRLFEYDSRGDLAIVTDAAGNFWDFEYTGHLLTRETDRERLSFYFGYSGIGQDAYCVRTWGDGGIYDHELTYDKQSKVTCVTNSLGHTTTYRMDLVGTVVEIIDPHGASTKHTYDARSLQQTSETNALGETTAQTFDARGNCVRIEPPDGAAILIEYHPRFDLPVKVTAANGAVWTWSYDTFGRLTARTNPFGHAARYTYEEGRLVRIVTPGGATTELTYDAEQNIASVRSPTGGETRLQHDRQGRVIKLVNPRGGVERRQHDVRGDLVQTESSHGVTRQLEYDKEQNLTRAADSLRDVSFTYAGYHQLFERIEAGVTIRFHRDTEDQLVSVENEAGEHYRFELDERGLVTTETGFDGFARRYARDLAGRVTRVDKASGESDELRHDALGRITDVLHSDGTYERYRYDAAGGLIEASNPDAEVYFERDELGRVIRELTRLPNGTEQWIQSGYGPDGHRLRVQSSDGHLHHIERDEAGDVRRVELEGRRWQVDFERDALGLELRRIFPGGVASSWERDSAGRPTRRMILSGAEGILDDKRLEWEGEDQIRAILDARRGDARYTHDARGRLVKARLPWGEEQQRAMDAVGNIYGGPGLDDRRYGAGGRIEEAAGTAYRHDADGNLIEKADLLGDVTRYRWNGAGMLSAVELPDGREVGFTYDVMARRLSKVVREPTGGDDGDGRALRVVKEVRWVWDGHNPLSEFDSEEGKTTWLFDPETFNPLAKLKDGAVWGVVTDQIGTPTELIAQDGTVAYSTQIDVHGESRPIVRETECPFRWPGQYADEETGLSYNRWRYYDASAELYMSTDPFTLFGGRRLYGYVENPLTWIDPLGLSRCAGDGSQRPGAYYLVEIRDNGALAIVSGALTQRQAAAHLRRGATARHAFDGVYTVRRADARSVAARVASDRPSFHNRHPVGGLPHYHPSERNGLPHGGHAWYGRPHEP